MARLRMRFKLPRKESGIVLEKLEAFLAESRKFLTSMAEDLTLHEPSAKWLGLDFKNGSLSYTAEYPYTVIAPQKEKFNHAIISLAKNERVDFVKPYTATHFYGLTQNFVDEKPLKVAIFPNGNEKAKWVELPKEVALAASRASAPYAEYIGAAQGIVHSWYKEALPDPYFYLRELSSDLLIKCFYPENLYKEIALAVGRRSQIIHVHGQVKADTIRRTIESIVADKIARADAYSMADVIEFLHPGASA
jgi:hypothetical protein